MTLPIVTHHIRTRTEIVYPDGGPTYVKWDYFVIDNEALPDGYHHEKELTNEAWYEFLNEGGYGQKGWQEITPEHEEWIKAHQADGSQTEKATDVEFVS